MNVKTNEDMNYNQPLQHLGYVGLKATKAIYLRSTINVLAKAGTTFSRISITQGPRINENTNTGNTPLPDYIIDYLEVTDNSRTVDETFRDIVDIKLVSNISFPVQETDKAVQNQLKSYLAQTKRIEIRVMVRVQSDGPTGKVTTTISENAEIEIS